MRKPGPSWASLSAWGSASCAVAALATGCFYTPPPPTALEPIRGRGTVVSLHLTADLLGAIEGRPLLSSMGFYPSLRLGLTDEGEMVFSPWPAYRHWIGLYGGQPGYHQFSVAAYLPLGAWLRRQEEGGYRPPVVQALRYDFRTVDVDCFRRPWEPRSDVNCRPKGVVAGGWIAFRTNERGPRGMGVTVGAAFAYGASDLGVSVEPELLSITLRPHVRGLWPWGSPPYTLRPWLPAIRVGVWGGG